MSGNLIPNDLGQLAVFLASRSNTTCRFRMFIKLDGAVDEQKETKETECDDLGRMKGSALADSTEDSTRSR